MSNNHAQKSNENNLKLRNSYKRYFIWGSIDKPGFRIGLKKPKIKFSDGFKTRMSKADDKRLFKKASVVLLFFIVIILIAYIVFKM